MNDYRKNVTYLLMSCCIFAAASVGYMAGYESGSTMFEASMSVADQAADNLARCVHELEATHRSVLPR